MSGLVHVMETPLVLSLVGGNYINKTGRQGISISESKMLKIQQEHNLSTAVVKQIPKAISLVCYPFSFPVDAANTVQAS